MKKYRIETNCVQAGYSPKNGEPRVLPINASTTFRYDSSENMAKLFSLEAEGHFYSRLQNPTSDAVAAKIAALEGGEYAMLTSSGQAAVLFSVLNICESGDHLVSSSAVYGGTYNLFAVTLKKMGIDVTFIDPDSDSETIRGALRKNTKLLYGETISNPTLVVLDVERYAGIAHVFGVPLIVDNTFATPINCRPIEWGADIVVHSTTKYMEGHASTIGGAIVDSGNFDWMAYPERYPGLTQPDESYHGKVYARDFGKKAYITKAVCHLMRDLGATPSPFDAFLLNHGLESLHLRMARHCSNALAVAEYLENDPRISWVNYCGLKSSKYYPLTRKYLPNGSCGVVSFGVKGGREAATRFMDSLELAAIVTHVADARTCVIHPASTTQSQLTEEQLAASGISSDLIRLSVGIENVEDIIEDIDQALSQAYR